MSVSTVLHQCLPTTPSEEVEIYCTSRHVLHCGCLFTVFVLVCMTCFEQLLVFSQWAFGVTLWELMTLGQTPYVDIDPFEMSAYLKDGYRIAQPINCPDEL